MKIALISEHASPLATLGGIDAGGQNIYVMHVAQCLAHAGHEVDVFTRRDDTKLPTVVYLRPGLRVIHIDAGPARFVPKEQLLQHMPEFAHACEVLCRNVGGYDVVHANFFMSGWVALHLKQTLGLPFAITFHALGLVRREHQRSADAFPDERIDIERTLVEEADCIIAECPQDRTDLIRLYGADPGKTVMVPCGFDPDEFAPMDRLAARRELGLDPDEFVVLQLGRLVPRKGIDNVIRAMAHLPRDLPARLLVVGGESDEPDERVTPEIGRLRGVARDVGVEPRITFTGRRQRHELRRYYCAADVFVTTPWYEPFGITPLEAMACGAPVVGSEVGGIQYTVMQGVTGYLVPPHDPQALAERLAALQANPALARALGRAGIRRARSMFTWDRVATQIAAALAALHGVTMPAPSATVVPMRRRPAMRLTAIQTATT
ncbi:glycosyltransferase family 1 protein [Schlegelella sp. S2-27]|uniref:Glycosyltransferase family 1 protein n=1 Tax=Caldimonas mangrovi TaxID=2944811 RepID=A0ABT0YL69_9BURK|nr:glycosyltransferase family 1 protein [Caldimonas mangrovi]MCM5679476.1 glycosyltransferase family 1 protein [Caldimonas mangrovi]